MPTAVGYGAQPAIARWESGRTAISVDDMVRLIRLCGLDIEFSIVDPDDSDGAQAARLAALTGQQRLERHTRASRQFAAVRAAGAP